MARIEVKTDISGTVWQIETAPGDTVEEEGVILLIEAMKMEIPVMAPEAGTVMEILVAEGDQVVEGQAVAVMEA
mgnify:CR=1 FL=1